jgi:hypothetical protein
MEKARHPRPVTAAGARIDLLFTMSENTGTAAMPPAPNSVSHERACRLAELAAQPSGGARRDRTDDLLLAKQALSQLSYGPAPVDIDDRLAEP